MNHYLQGVGTEIIDPFEMFRKSKSHSYGRRSSPPMSKYTYYHMCITHGRGVSVMLLGVYQLNIISDVVLFS